MSRNPFFLSSIYALDFCFLEAKSTASMNWRLFPCRFCFWWVFWLSKKKKTNHNFCSKKISTPKLIFPPKTSRFRKRWGVPCRSRISWIRKFKDLQLQKLSPWRLSEALLWAPQPTGTPNHRCFTPGGFGRPWPGQGMTHETAEQILVGHFDPRSNHRHSWLVAAGSNPAYEQFALQCPHPPWRMGWEAWERFFVGLKKEPSLLVDVLFFMAAGGGTNFGTKAPEGTPFGPKLSWSGCFYGTSMPWNSRVEIVDILRAEWNI